MPVISRARLIPFLAYFIVTIIYFTLGIYVIRKDNKSPKNRLFFIISILLSLWALSFGLSLAANSSETALSLRRIGAVGYLSFYSLFLHFTLILAENKSILKSKLLLILLYLPAALMIYNFSLSPYMLNYYEMVELNIGWVVSAEHTEWSLAFYIYYISYILISMLLLWRWGRNARTTRKQKQAQLILKTLVLAFIIGTAVDIIPPHLGYNQYPDLSIIFILIPALGILYSIEKYKLMDLSPDRIAGDILETMNEGLIVTDNIGMVKMVNQSTLNQLNFRKRELLEEPIDKIIKDDSLIDSFFSGTNKRDMIKYQDKVLETKEGQDIPVLFSIATLQDDWGDYLGFICTFSNIKERVEAEEKLRKLNEELEAKVARRTKELQYLANHDSLTRLPNRRLFIDRLNESINIAEEKEQSIMVAMLDLDGFKEVNDTLGHEKGDNLLKLVAARLRENLRDKDIVARYGGDEFIIKCKDINNKKSAEVVSDKIFNSFQETYEVGGKTFDITASMGVAFYPEDGQDVETLTNKADEAMYQSKESGKSQYSFYGDIKEQARSDNNA